MNLVVDVDHVLADLRELADLTGGPDGARRLAWSEDWIKAREFLLGKLGELPVTIDRDEAGNIWAQLAGANADGGVRDRRLARRRGARGRLAGRRAGRVRRAGRAARDRRDAARRRR